MLTAERLEEIKERRQQGAPDNPIGNANYVEMVDFVFYALTDRHALITEVERLRAALEFYADEKNHTEPRGTRIFGDVIYDKGIIARQALAGEPND